MLSRVQKPKFFKLPEQLVVLFLITLVVLALCATATSQMTLRGIAEVGDTPTTTATVQTAAMQTGDLILVFYASQGAGCVISAKSWSAGTAVATTSGTGCVSVTVGKIICVGGATQLGFNTCSEDRALLKIDQNNLSFRHASRSPIYVKRMWDGGPLRQFAQRQLPGFAPVKGGFVGPYICEKCQEPSETRPHHIGAPRSTVASAIRDS
jgi:hypothetical protein